MPRRMKLNWSLRTKAFRSGSGSVITSTPAFAAARRTSSARSDSSSPFTSSCRSGLSGRNMSVLRLATMLEPCGHRGMLREPVGAEETFLLRRDRDEQQRAPRVGLPPAQRGRGLEQGGDARGVVHRPVVDAVAALRLAHAQVVEMGGEGDVLRCHGRIGAGQQADHVVRDRLALVHRDRRPESDRKIEPGERGAAVGQGLQRGIALRGAGEEALRSRVIEHDGDRRVPARRGRVRGEPHLRMQARERVALPRDVRVRRRDGDDPDRAGGAERVGSRGPRGRQGGAGDPAGRGAGQDHGHLALEVEALQVIVARAPATPARTR